MIALAIVKIFFIFFTVPGRQRLVGIDCVGYSKDFFIFYFFIFLLCLDDRGSSGLIALAIVKIYFYFFCCAWTTEARRD